MLEKLWIGLLSAAVFVLLFNQLSSPLQGQVTPLKEMKIGVVDFSKVAKNYKKYKKIKKMLDYEEKKAQMELDMLKQEIELLQKELKVLNPQSKLFQKKERILNQKKADAVYLVKKYREELKEKATKATQEILDDLETAVEAYGQMNGFHLVLRRYLPLQGRIQMNFNTVLYHDKAVDITEEVIQQVNTLFSKKGKGVGSGQGTGTGT